MLLGKPVLVAAMLFLPAGEAPQNRWKEEVPSALEAVQRSFSPETYRRALDVTWRADDWRAGLELARGALERHASVASLRGPVARALWRGGKLEQAEAVVDTIDVSACDRVALVAVVEIQLARGRFDQARPAARRLEKLEPLSATELYQLLALRLADDRLEGLPAALRAASRRVDPDNGYPETYLAEALDGLPEFFAAVGTDPINRIIRHGSADMPLMTTIRLPYCLALINGEGPYRLVVDTGGSITLSLDDDVSRELGLRSLGSASIRGVSGKQRSQQSLVEELQIGEITVRRVMTRAFAMPELMAFAADGIIGTGVFSRARMTLDFERARLVVARSSDIEAPGTPVTVRIVGDAKLIAPIEVEDQYAVAVLDSGADVAAVSPARLAELFPDRTLKNLPVAGLGVGQGESAGLSFAPGVKLEVWGRTYESYSGIGLDAIDTLLSPILGVQTQVLIGMPIFRDLKSWSIDYPRRRMWVDWVE